MKIVTVLGTRPEIIRLSRIIEKLDRLCDHVLVHTGQNFDPSLSDVFFRELDIRQPDHYLGVRGDTFGEQIGKIIAASEQVLLAERPDRLLVLGDTNSALAAIVAKRLGIPVYHMEAGNRCYDDRVPEEVNRRLIDHSSDVLMPYTARSASNLVREGIPRQRIYVIGNPIYEVICHYDAGIRQSTALADLGLESKRYFLATVHRAENVDSQSRLANVVAALDQIQKKYGLPVLVSTHPRTQTRMRDFGLASENEQVRFLPPFGLFDFLSLEQNALVVLSDSGTVQEECCIFGVASVTLRDVTERPETIEGGSNILAGAQVDLIARAVEVVLSDHSEWRVPEEYLAQNVSQTVTKILFGYAWQLGRTCRTDE